MEYIKYKPDASLLKYIDFYWTLQTDSTYRTIKVPLFADVYTDIFVNFGSAASDFNGYGSLLPGRLYVGGVTTSSCSVSTYPNSTFIGIRFKPGGLPVFYNMPLFEIVDQIIEFQDKQLSSILDLDELLPKRLDQYFISRQNNAILITSLTEIVENNNGLISVDQLAQKCNMSTRTMERLFNLNVGISPKEFIGIVRFQQALKTLQKAHFKGKLLDVAFKTGYYDHAHLTREVKKYSGLTPSGIWPGPNFP